MILSRTERLGTLWRHRGPGAAQMQDLSAQNPTPQALLPAGWVPYWNRAAVTGGGGGGAWSCRRRGWASGSIHVCEALFLRSAKARAGISL